MTFGFAGEIGDDRIREQSAGRRHKDEDPSSDETQKRSTSLEGQALNEGDEIYEDDLAQVCPGSDDERGANQDCCLRGLDPVEQVGARNLS